MDWDALFTSPDGKGFIESPLFYGALGGGAAAYALYTIATGSIAVNKGGSVVVTRAQSPGFFWLSVLIIGALGAGLLLQAVRQYRRNVE